MNTDMITVRGLVATTPRFHETSDGVAITNFRLACMQRTFDEASGKWKDEGTNWYTVYAKNDLARNLNESLEKGQRLILTGRLVIREYSVDGSPSGVLVEIEATSVGHDLSYGKTVFERVHPRDPETAPKPKRATEHVALA
jgi:single-strand DNA-binding protein